ncbi:MAG: T9SS type A sorting domain-containing protein [Saprospiraceae bacterium]|nr:T9SS type A sorting domain-containing protein [Saprospiraceae bacterium]MCF8249519.1 T9SS type A sorting domain-containing protein [Saprospiraceae bacterium]MCF8280144.1 T9SS type A sorting domain-containing protein [Bacteroidales bacterium]MCF8310737.1 T9SS type A sorting domain-containing protein [Saprospiraceae bacterium]MCF8439432.1 T9SS type A sorting domain-containing protein [Saprospiraceae bacterium]
MLRFIFFCIFLVVFSINNYAQYKHDYIWLFGDPITEPSEYNGITVFDFNGDTLNITKQWEGMWMYASNVSISNTFGELQFYSNGCKVFSKNNQLMMNGSGLSPGDAYLSGFCPDVGVPVPKGMIALPFPNHPDKYYLINQSPETGLPGDFSYYIGYLYSAVIDMSSNNGLGEVQVKNQVILHDTLFSNLHAVKHANAQDWWIVLSKSNRNVYYKVLLTENGIDSIQSQEIGIAPDPYYSGSGQSSFSPDGTKYARVDKKNQVTMFDFDRATGELSNFQQIVADTQAFWTSLSFSPNSRFLYISTTWKLWQFDMLAPNIQASKVLIDEYDGFTYLDQPMIFYLMQLAPDCKIYMIGSNGTKFLHVIEHPDEPGLACDFRQHGLELPAINNGSIPNFPNYRLGTEYPVCDSSIVYTASGFTLPPVQEVQVWPNPASNELNLEFSTITGKPVRFRLFDATGQLAREWKLEGSQTQSLNLHGLTAGLYFWQLNTVEGLPLDKGKLVIVK